ncbi:MAG TPA: DUF1801 domain-containing protein [Kofleriaceae bacterium]|jgi:hypothetical protein|nr:DUF1801 domain-containing protein [Kofleriaceae bacterium]
MNPSELIDQEIADHPDWRGQTMAEIRRIIRDTVPDVTEEWKWRGTPTWSHNGILCICNAFKSMVKVTFLHGAKLTDVDGVFNAELGGNQWRAIKIFEGDRVNARGLKKLLVAAVALNATKGPGKAKPARAGGARAGKPAAATRKPPRATGRPPKGARTSPKARRTAARGASSKR